VRHKNQTKIGIIVLTTCDESNEINLFVDYWCLEKQLHCCQPLYWCGAGDWEESSDFVSSEHCGGGAWLGSAAGGDGGRSVSGARWRPNWRHLGLMMILHHSLLG